MKGGPGCGLAKQKNPFECGKHLVHLGLLPEVGQWPRTAFLQVSIRCYEDNTLKNVTTPKNYVEAVKTAYAKNDFGDQKSIIMRLACSALTELSVTRIKHLDLVLLQRKKKLFYFWGRQEGNCDFASSLSHLLSRFSTWTCS